MFFLSFCRTHFDRDGVLNIRLRTDVVGVVILQVDRHFNKVQLNSFLFAL